MVERFLLDLTIQRIRRGVFHNPEVHNIKDPIAAIHEYVDHHNRVPKRFILDS